MEELDPEESARELFALTTLDGAVSSGATLAPGMGGAREIAADASRSLEDRLEAREGIIDSEVAPLPSDRYVAIIAGRRS